MVYRNKSQSLNNQTCEAMSAYRLTTAIALTVLLGTSASYAQQAMRWGLGIGIPGNRADLAATLFEVTTPLGFYVSINAGQLRLEPELGLLLMTFDEAGFSKQKLTALQVCYATP